MSEFSEVDKHNILVNWWRESCKEFSLYYLIKSESERREILLSCSPDMPDEPAGTRENRGETITASDMLLPELFLEGLQAGQGRCLILLLTRRLASPDTGLENDLQLMKALHDRGQMPIFSDGKLTDLNTPFVDIRDPTRSIQCLAKDSSPNTIMATKQHIKDGRLIDADVWLTTVMRRNILADFMMGLRDLYCRDLEKISKEVEKCSTNDEKDVNIEQNSSSSTLDAVE